MFLNISIEIKGEPIWTQIISIKINTCDITVSLFDAGSWVFKSQKPGSSPGSVRNGALSDEVVESSEVTVGALWVFSTFK